jgi:hypothetical protein
MSEHESRSAQDKGALAMSLAENALLNEALDAIDKEVMEQWVNCPARDKDGKEALWQLIKTSRKFRSILTGYIESGKLATDRLKYHEKPSMISRLRG